MLCRLARLLLVGALAATTVVALGADAASPQTGPVGYSVGAQFTGVDGNTCSLYAIDLSTGEATAVNDPGDDIECADGLTFSPDGTLYAYTNPPAHGFSAATLITIDPATGVQTPVGDLPPVITGSGGMTFDGAGNLWLYGATPGPGIDPDCAPTQFAFCLWQVNPADGSSTFVGPAPSGTGVYGLAGSCDQVLAITATFAFGPSNGSEIDQVDTTTAALTEVVPLPDVVIPTGLDYDAEGGLWALAGTRDQGIGAMEIDLIDLATGDVMHTPISVGGSTFEGFLSGLGIVGATCPVPPPAPAPEVVLAPTFTG